MLKLPLCNTSHVRCSIYSFNLKNMLKLKFFPPGKEEEFNKFTEKYPPRNTKSQSGIILNQNGVYLFYEDGVPMQKEEQVALLLEEIRMKKTEILIGTPMLKLKADETEDFRVRLAKLDKTEEKAEQLEGKKEKYDVQKKIKQTKDDLMKKIEGNEAWMLTTTQNQEMCRLQIKHLELTIKSLEDGELVI